MFDVWIVVYVEVNQLVLVIKDDDFCFWFVFGVYCFVWLCCGNIINCVLCVWLGQCWFEVYWWLEEGDVFVEVR